ncbi:MAG: phospho-N-acetylmuramoyl-pentapeptide-transferase [Halanaerobium sp.]|nr:phospho-N-acetylmuramoyl-pentapeptide-transferase [Halanaerobium sp.]
MLRIVASGLIAFFTVVILGPMVIAFLRSINFGQHIREEGPERHLSKQGIPTMGGMIILLGLLPPLLFLRHFNSEVNLVLLMTLGFALLGALDDVIKIAASRSLGLKARHKLLGQIILGLLLGIYVYTKEVGTDIIIPFYSGTLNLGILIIPFVALVVVSEANAVNLTDGLDGLAAGVTSIAAMTFSIVSFYQGKMGLAVLCMAIAGACLGFSWFNSHPAQVFMGDTGSLALGGALAAIAVLTRTELLLVIIGGVFTIEALSVVIQVLSFQVRGKRVFRMSPIHHHFELGGWEEAKIVVRFWLLSIVLAAAGLIGYFYATSGF